tara:strand:- start:314 stop:622 length:309 start_codon:yes stop_codon:yes gene_type:complete
MALDLSDKTQFPYIKGVSQGETWLEVKLPRGANQITIGSETTKIFFGSNDCTDGGTPSQDRIFIPANNLLPIRIGKGSERVVSIFIASSSGTATIKILLEEV